ncbi:hypothetical protein PMAYCL1PPCAC_23663, partial [Pristionchus mayeri]
LQNVGSTSIWIKRNSRDLTTISTTLSILLPSPFTSLIPFGTGSFNSILDGSLRTCLLWGGWALVMGCFLLQSLIDYKIDSNSVHSTSPPIPNWFWLLAAICTFTAHTMDGTDGKQARRIGASGPTGELSDHGLDSWSTVPFTITIFSVFGQGVFRCLSVRLLMILQSVQTVLHRHPLGEVQHGSALPLLGIRCFPIRSCLRLLLHFHRGIRVVQVLCHWFFHLRRLLRDRILPVLLWLSLYVVQEHVGVAQGWNSAAAERVGDGPSHPPPPSSSMPSLSSGQSTPGMTSSREIPGSSSSQWERCSPASLVVSSSLRCLQRGLSCGTGWWLSTPSVPPSPCLFDL